MYIICLDNEDYLLFGITYYYVLFGITYYYVLFVFTMTIKNIITANLIKQRFHHIGRGLVDTRDLKSDNLMGCVVFVEKHSPNWKIRGLNHR